MRKITDEQKIAIIKTVGFLRNARTTAEMLGYVSPTTVERLARKAKIELTKKPTSYEDNKRAPVLELLKHTQDIGYITKIMKERGLEISRYHVRKIAKDSGALSETALAGAVPKRKGNRAIDGDKRALALQLLLETRSATETTARMTDLGKPIHYQTVSKIAKEDRVKLKHGNAKLRTPEAGQG